MYINTFKFRPTLALHLANVHKIKANSSLTNNSEFEGDRLTGVGLSSLSRSVQSFHSSSTKVQFLPPMKKARKRKGKPYYDLIQVLEKYQKSITLRGALEYLAEPLPNLSQNSNDLLQRIPIMTSSPNPTSEVVKPKEKSKFQIIKEKKFKQEHTSKVEHENREKLSRENDLKLSLRAYIEVSIHANLLPKAHDVVMFYRNRGKQKGPSPVLRDIEIFNLLLQGWSHKGNFQMLKGLIGILAQDKIELNASSYAAWLECLARQPKENLDEAKNVLKAMAQQGFKIRDIYQKHKFSGDQEQCISELIAKLRANYAFKPSISKPPYICSLLGDLDQQPSSEIRPYTPLQHLCSEHDLHALASEQFARELAGEVSVKSVRKTSEINENLALLQSKQKILEEGWRAIALNSFKRNLKYLNLETEAQKTPSIFPYLSVLEPDAYIDILMAEAKSLTTSESFSPPLYHTYRMMGMKVYSRYLVWVKLQSGAAEKTLVLFKKFLSKSVNVKNHDNYREVWNQIKTENWKGPSIDSTSSYWPYFVLVEIGRFLFDILLHDFKVNVNIMRKSESQRKLIPAFYKITQRSGLYVKEEAKPHPVILKLYRGFEVNDLIFDASLVPMLCPPVPWTSIQNGGQLLINTNFIRLTEMAFKQRSMIRNSPPQQMYPSFDALNILEYCPWIINKPILDLIIDVFNKNGSKGLDIPQNPSILVQPPKPECNAEKANKSQLAKERMIYRQTRLEMYSLWCDALYKLSIANHFRDHMFWFPHNIDFRGRVYPTPPHFNHLGSDFTRSILLFAHGLPLGEKGLDWLKIHAINLTGLKKRESIEARLSYANEIIDDILDSADKPFDGKMWWSESDEPWQTLACCKEIANAIRSGDPKTFISHFPVHQDGSCNGLQHYAALGRDQHGAESVNLHPSLVPQDVYSGVAALVECERQKDAANGVKIAKILEGHIQRKVIKQTVMTMVYGVTKYGAKFQILKQLKDIDNFPTQSQWPAASYLTTKTFSIIQQMFSSARCIQDWFTECARVITSIQQEPVEWVTPLGLPVVQPYTRPSVIKSRSYLGSIASNLGSRVQTDSYQLPNVMKQKNAFPPNFIHSLDSCHMMLTALYCQRAGITFVSVHDCFWTHPSTVDIMNKVCREQFYALHSEPILENLSEYLVQKFSYPPKQIKNDNSIMDHNRKTVNEVLVRIPEKGDFKLENVLKSVYFFS